MMIKLRLVRAFSAFGLLLFGLIPAFAADSTREIEEIVIYGERVESTVSDTSIAITAMSEDFLRDMGVQGPNEMVNFIPATTRTDWDIKIRGVGRNFRGLGGDPGVGTYYNGIYSPDFGIAATESGLYDIQRIEVLRGPQGTLYGRNSIGGVLNYVTNQPNHDEFEASMRTVLGQYSTNEYYGFVSGPITDTVAYRLVGVKRNRKGAVEGIFSEDLEGVNDQNVALTLDWHVTDQITANLRINDRRSLRAANFGSGFNGIASEGPCISMIPGKIVDDVDDCDPRYRVSREIRNFAPGFRPVSVDWFNTYGDLADNANGAVAWTNPVTGALAYGAFNRPGVDSTGLWPFMPSANYGSAAVAAYDIGGADAPDNIRGLTNNASDEEFDQQAASLVIDWDITENLSIRYLGNYSSFVYWFNRDNDFSNNYVSDNNDTVIEDVDSWSHELRVFWSIGDRWTATSGIYNFQEDRSQWYGIRERAAQGRVINAVDYGTAEHPDWLLDALALVGWIPGDEISQTGVPQCFDWTRAPRNQADETVPGGGYGIYCGDPGTNYDHDNDTGAVYEHRNFTENENLAFYTQGDFQINDSWSVTVGARYSKDWRDGFEQRGGYSELTADSWLPWAIATVANGTEAGVNDAASDFFQPGVTPLAAMNVAMGAATFNYMPDGVTINPDFPITPTCDLLAQECAHPLRLEGIPISWGHRTEGTFKQEGQWTFRLNFNWEPTDDILVYLGITEGYRAGGWNMGGPENRGTIDTNGNGIDDLRVLLEYGGEEITSFELGYKGTHFDGTLQLNIAVYYYDYKNYQDQVERWEEESADFSLPNVLLPGGQPLQGPPGRGPVSVVANIADAVNKGFEVEALWLATEALTLGGNFSYTLSEYDAPYTFFNEGDPRYPRAVFGGDLTENPCNMEPEIKALYCLEIEGYQLQGIPKEKATVWGSYAWNFNIGTLTWYHSVAYTGDYTTHPFDRPWDRVPARERWDTRFSFRAADGSWSTSLFVDNVLDKQYIRSSDMDRRRTGYGINWGQRIVALYPRFIGFEATYNFGAAR